MDDAESDEVVRPFAEWWPPFSTLVELWAQGRLQDSAALLEDGIRQHPRAAAMKLSLAFQITLEDGGCLDPANVARARGLVREAVASDPDNPDGLVVAARTMYSLGDVESTLAYVDKLKPLHEQLDSPMLTAGMLHLLGLLARDAGETVKATGALRIAVDLNPEAGEYAADLVAVLVDTGQPDEALAVLENARRTAPGHPALRDAAKLVDKHA